jgi:hypothetical protein
MGLSIAEYRALTNKTLDRNLRKAKYHNVKVETEEGAVDSKREAKRLRDLRLRQRAGQISDLRTQVKYSLDVNGHHICDYFADFVYLENGVKIVADAKGIKTPVYKLKKKLMKAIHAIEIMEC